MISVMGRAPALQHVTRRCTPFKHAASLLALQRNHRTLRFSPPRLLPPQLCQRLHACVLLAVGRMMQRGIWHLRDDSGGDRQAAGRAARICLGARPPPAPPPRPSQWRRAARPRHGCGPARRPSEQSRCAPRPPAAWNHGRAAASAATAKGGALAAAGGCRRRRRVAWASCSKQEGGSGLRDQPGCALEPFVVRSYLGTSCSAVGRGRAPGRRLHLHGCCGQHDGSGCSHCPIKIQAANRLGIGCPAAAAGSVPSGSGDGNPLAARRCVHIAVHSSGCRAPIILRLTASGSGAMH